MSSSGLADWPWGGMDSLRRDANGAPGSMATPCNPSASSSSTSITATRDVASTSTGNTPSVGDDGECELLIIAHGLQGQAEDFRYMLETLESSDACTSGQLLIHATRVNTDRTHDGVEAGGLRLADDIRETVARLNGEGNENGTDVHINIDNLKPLQQSKGRQPANKGRKVKRLSLLGFSLGGLYVRYAAAELYEPDTKTMCGGLVPGSLILVASPHLGVRRFGVYRFVPEAVRGVKVFGDTVREMMLMDDDGILERMSRDDEYEEEVYEDENEDDDDDLDAVEDVENVEQRIENPQEQQQKQPRMLLSRSVIEGGVNGSNSSNDAGFNLMMMARRKKDDNELQSNQNSNSQLVRNSSSGASTNGGSRMTGAAAATRSRKRRLLFVSALQAFELRVLYANIRNDLMVNFGTAALEPGVCAVSGNEIERVMRKASETPCAIDNGHDDKGCKICFQYWIDDGSNNGTSSSSSSSSNGNIQGRQRQQQREMTVFRRRRQQRQRNQNSNNNSTEDEDEDEDEYEQQEGIREVVMAQRLRSIGWWVIGVDFPVALPIAHNRIVAMSRNFIHAWINCAGHRAVHHLVDTICQRFNGHSTLFRRTDCDGDEVTESEGWVANGGGQAVSIVVGANGKTRSDEVVLGLVDATKASTTRPAAVVVKEDVAKQSD